MSFVSLAQKYWKEILFAVILFSMSAFWYYDRSSLIQAMDIATERYEKELQVIKESTEREEKRKEKLLEEYRAKILLLEKDYERIEEQIDQAKEKRIDQLKELRIENPKKLINEIEQAFGFEYVE